MVTKYSSLTLNKRHYSSSSSESEPEVKRKSRKQKRNGDTIDTQNGKSGKKVRSKSRNRRQERKTSCDQSAEIIIKHEKVQTGSAIDSKPEKHDVKVEFNKNSKKYSEHVKDDLKFENERKWFLTQSNLV